MLSTQRTATASISLLYRGAFYSDLIIAQDCRLHRRLLCGGSKSQQFRSNSSSTAAATNSATSAANSGNSGSANQYKTPSFISRKNVTTTTKSRTTEALAVSTSFDRSTRNVSASSTANTSKIINQNGRFQLPPNMVFRSAAAANTTFAAGHATLAGLQGTISAEDNNNDICRVANDNMASISSTTTAARPLVLLFAWMLSKNQHIEKYRQFWTARGYDILTVQTRPLDLLLPTIGGRRIAANVFDLLAQISPVYDQIVVHAFSVGGYQLAEYLSLLSARKRAGDPIAARQFGAMKAWIIDSCVFADDCAPGLSRAITHHPVAQPMIERSIKHFLRITRRFTLDHYHTITPHLFGNEMRVPGLLLISEDDVVSSVKINYKLADEWRKRNVITHVKCWNESYHVLHYREHPQEYEYEVDKFVGSLATITKAPKREPVIPSNSTLGDQ